MDVIKSVITIQTIMSFRLFCGFYYKISSNELVNFLMRAYCVFIASILFLLYYMVTMYYDFPAKVFYGITCTYYTTNVFISLHFSGENLVEFLKKIRQITPRLKLSEEIPISRIIFTFLLLGRIITYVVNGINESFDQHVFAAITLLFIFDIPQHMSNFTRIIMFEILWHRLALLCKQFEEDLSVARRFEEGENVMKIKLRSCMNSYKNILNTTRETAVPMKFMIFSSMVFLNAKMLNIIYLYINYKRGGFSYKTSIVVCEAIMDFTATLLPALLAEMVSSEIDKIKLCVAKQLLVCRGVTTRNVIDDAMIFFRQRPFKYTIWRLFTVDVNMILSFFGLLTTNTIAMVQFAHFFD